MVPGQPKNIPNVHILYLELNQSPLCVLHIALTSSWSTLARSGPLAVRRQLVPWHCYLPYSEVDFVCAGGRHTGVARPSGLFPGRGL